MSCRIPADRDESMTKIYGTRDQSMTLNNTKVDAMGKSGHSQVLQSNTEKQSGRYLRHVRTVHFDKSENRFRQEFYRSNSNQRIMLNRQIDTGDKTVVFQKDSSKCSRKKLKGKPSKICIKTWEYELFRQNLLVFHSFDTQCLFSSTLVFKTN